MKKCLFALFAAAAMLVPALSAEETREIRLVQDDAQVKLVTKVYKTKNLTRANEIRGYVIAAVRRYCQNSFVRGLNAGPNDQYLIVTTADKFIPYVDQIIATLDRGTVKNKYGSVVEGSGYSWKVYRPKYRLAEELLTPAIVMLSGVGNCYAQNNKLWLKDDIGDVDYALEWIQYFDRPLPQVRLTFRYYFVRESTLRDVGIDYLAWKNGPGMNLLDMAFSNGKFSWDKALNTAGVLFSSANWSTFGCLTAPAFDMSFIRLLQQSGKAKVVATADIVMVNNQDQASLTLLPVYNALVKDPENHAASVQAINLTDFAINVYKPTICFGYDQKDLNEYGWIPSTKEFYARNKGAVIFAYDMASSDAVEGNNFGTQIGSSTATSSTKKTLVFGKEQILANGCREFDVEQTTGVPFLCQLPILKYIFGTTTTMQEKNYMYVTVEASLVHPEDAGAKDADAGKTAEKAAAKPAEKTAEKAAAKPTEKPAEKTEKAAKK